MLSRARFVILFICAEVASLCIHKYVNNGKGNKKRIRIRFLHSGSCQRKSENCLKRGKGFNAFSVLGCQNAFSVGRACFNTRLSLSYTCQLLSYHRRIFESYRRSFQVVLDFDFGALTKSRIKSDHFPRLIVCGRQT